MNTQIKEQQGMVNAGVNGAQTTTTKKRRRGINNETRAASRLKFDERRDAKPNGLFIGHLDNIEITWATIGEEVTGLQSFAGLAVPRLVLTFASNDKEEVTRRYVIHSFMPAESNALTIVGGKESWKVDSVLGWMKHVMDVFVLKGRPMTEEEEDALCLPFEDSDEDGNYIPVEPQVVIDGWRSVFENFVKILNNDGKPYYKSATGDILPIWMKLLRFVKVKGSWNAIVRGASTNGDLGFTNFVGEGCIELFKQQVPPMLKVDASKESIVYKETTKPAAPTMPGVGMMGGMAGGMPIVDANVGVQQPSFDGGTGFNVSQAEDMPF